MEERGEKLLSAEENDRPRRSVEGMKSEMPSVMKTGTRNAHTRGSRVSDSARGLHRWWWCGGGGCARAPCQRRANLKQRRRGASPFCCSLPPPIVSFRLSEQKFQGMGRGRTTCLTLFACSCLFVCVSLCDQLLSTTWPRTSACPPSGG